MGNKQTNKKKLSKFKVRQIRKQSSLLKQRSAKGVFIKKSTAERHSDVTPSTSGGADICDTPSFITLNPVGLQTTEQGSQNVVDSPKSSEPVTTSYLANSSGESYELSIEVENKEDDFQSVSGRRIVDINFLLRELQDKARHSNLFDCKTSDFQLTGEKRIGLTSVFKFQCQMCQQTCLIHSNDTENTDKVDLNIAATTGIIASGIGYEQFKELCCSMDIPIFSSSYYSKLQNKVYEKWEQTANECMDAAAKKERDLAIAENRMQNGYPIIDVFVDGSWCARSYGTNYKASSGTAAIIGRKTKEVLYIGVKNKYCCVCSRAQNKQLVPKEHTCFKNFDGSSGSMENQILLEGFKSSIEMYGLIYKRMIGDGDASTYAKILNAKPYESQKITVEKIECRNHILRNFCKKLRSLTTETKYLLQHRKILTNIKIMTMRKVIVKCIKYHKDSGNPRHDSILILHNDIINSMPHAFGDHKMCQNYYCEKKYNDNNELQNIQNSTFIFRINSIVSSVAAKSRSLIEDVDTNTVECFNSVIAKFIGGKRINFAQKRGYQGRCSAAVVSFNTKSALSNVHKAFTGKNPSEIIRDLEQQRAKKRKYLKEHPEKKKRTLKQLNKKQNDYGPGTCAPDMLPKDTELAKEDFLKNLEILMADKKAVERSTILQRESSEWLEIRSKILTASNFGPICKRKSLLNASNLVKNILYKKNLTYVTSIAHGIEKEKQALLQLQQQENLEIFPCGLFIDEEYSFLGATPDGLVGDKMIVEVKCPISAFKIGMKPAIEKNKIQILKYNKNTNTCTLNKNSNWYYQIQGQLRVTGRQVCLLGIWVGENEPLYTRFIEKDDDFWSTNMETKLVQFYLKCLLPEIVDSRYKRGLPIRNQQDKENEGCTSDISNQPQSDLHEPGPSTQVLNIEKY